MPSPGVQRGVADMGRGGLRDEDHAAAYADIDVGMGGGGFTPVGNPRDIRAGPDVPDMPSPDVIAAIADQLNAAAAETQFGSGAGAQAPALDPATSWAGGFNPELDQHWGVLDPTGTTNIQRVQSLREDQQRVNDQIEREIAAIEELNRVNRLSVQASNVTQPLPSSWSDPDEWGMENVRIGGPAMAESQLGAPRSPLGPDTARSAFPSPLTSVADYPAGDDWGMQDVRLDP